MDWERDGNSDCHASPTSPTSLLPRDNVKQAVYMKWNETEYVSIRSVGRYNYGYHNQELWRNKVGSGTVKHN
jgi:hypothetical protein